MNYCSICGTIEQMHVPDSHELPEPYCPRCHPRPLGPFDIDENEVWPSHGPQPVNIVTGGIAAPPYSVANGANDNTIRFDPTTGPISLEMNGSKVMTTYDELPETAGEGEIAFKKGESTAYVFDGEEWQNLGKVARKIRPSKDDKCDRRAAIAATRAKNNAE